VLLHCLAHHDAVESTRSVSTNVRGSDAARKVVWPPSSTRSLVCNRLDVSGSARTCPLNGPGAVAAGPLRHDGGSHTCESPSVCRCLPPPTSIPLSGSGGSAGSPTISAPPDSLSAPTSRRARWGQRHRPRLTRSTRWARRTAQLAPRRDGGLADRQGWGGTVGVLLPTRKATIRSTSRLRPAALARFMKKMWWMVATRVRARVSVSASAVIRPSFFSAWR
jgi:hypothetical protein